MFAEVGNCRGRSRWGRGGRGRRGSGSRGNCRGNHKSKHRGNCRGQRKPQRLSIPSKYFKTSQQSLIQFEISRSYAQILFLFIQIYFLGSNALFSWLDTTFMKFGTDIFSLASISVFFTLKTVFKLKISM